MREFPAFLFQELVRGFAGLRCHHGSPVSRQLQKNRQAGRRPTFYEATWQTAALDSRSGISVHETSWGMGMGGFATLLVERSGVGRPGKQLRCSRIVDITGANFADGPRF
jgi:hypothetical protein